MSFFTFKQNNSGGTWKGPLVVIVEANNADAANTIAERFGVYFDGCDAKLDCRCCGDRWYRAYDGNYGTTTPQIYDEPADKYPIDNDGLSQSLYGGLEILIAYQDGSVSSRFLPNKKKRKIPAKKVNRRAQK